MILLLYYDLQDSASCPTIVMAAYNNNDILMVPYEDLPDGDKDIIGKAIE